MRNEMITLAIQRYVFSLCCHYGRCVYHVTRNRQRAAAVLPYSVIILWYVTYNLYEIALVEHEIKSSDNTKQIDL